MNSSNEVSLDVFPFLQVLKDGNIRRLEGTQVVPAGLDPETNVLSKDINIVPETGVSARLYRPNSARNDQKLPLLVYYHGGGFFVASAYEPKFHTCLNKLVAEANIIAVSIDYRLVPEHPLPAAYDDSWAALRWVGSHVNGDNNNGKETWLKDYVDFGRVFLMGDSAGANIVHHMAMRLQNPDIGSDLKVSGLGLIHPYFWGKEPIGTEKTDEFRKKMVDTWWMFVCPSDKGCDDPYIDPFVDGAPSLEQLACDKVFVAVAEKDILRDRGRLYFEKLGNCGWTGKAEIEETLEEDHDFHIFNPNSNKAKGLIKRLASFINQATAV